MLQNKKKGLLYAGRLGLLLMAALLILAGCGNKGNNEGKNAQVNINDLPDDQIVASYEGGEVTGAEFKAYRGVTRLFMGPTFDQIELMDPTVYETLLHRLVGFELITVNADEQLRQEETDRAKKDLEELKTYITESGGEEAGIETMLKESGITEQDLLDYLIQSNIVHALKSKEVTDEAIQTEYNNLTAEHYYETATVRHILIGTTASEGQTRTKEEALKRAEEVLEQLKNGASMEELAAEFSDDPGSKENGGLYEDTNVNMWVPEFRDAAINLPLNEISEPVETNYGYHIMRVEARNVPTLDEVKEDVRGMVAQEVIAGYIENEVPGLIKETNLPAVQS